MVRAYIEAARSLYVASETKIIIGSSYLMIGKVVASSVYSPSPTPYCVRQWQQHKTMLCVTTNEAKALVNKVAPKAVQQRDTGVVCLCGHFLSLQKGREKNK